MTKDEKIEQLKDELDALNMRYLSQVSLYKSLYEEEKNKRLIDFPDDKLDDIIYKVLHAAHGVGVCPDWGNAVRNEVKELLKFEYE